MYPSENYPANQTCSWKVIVEENHFISLNFDYFYLPNCTDNYIKIYDGSNAMSPLLIELCNEENATRSTWNSTGNCIFIVYKSGESSGIDLEKRIGFSANYVKRKPYSLQGKQKGYKESQIKFLEMTSTLTIGTIGTMITH